MRQACVCTSYRTPEQQEAWESAKANLLARDAERVVASLAYLLELYA